MVIHMSIRLVPRNTRIVVLLGGSLINWLLLLFSLLANRLSGVLLVAVNRLFQASGGKLRRKRHNWEKERPQRSHWSRSPILSGCPQQGTRLLSAGPRSLLAADQLPCLEFPLAFSLHHSFC